MEAIGRAIQNESKNYRPLSLEETQRLAKRWIDSNHKDTEARDTIYHSIAPYCISLARKFRRGCNLPTSELGPLISAAQWGALEAIDHYDPSLGYRLTTYAFHWIRRALINYLRDELPVISVPRYMRSLSFRREILGQPVTKTQECKLKLADSALHPSSLNPKLGSNCDTNLRITARGNPPISATGIEKLKLIDCAMVGLPGNYYAVLRLRSWNYTLDEVGKLMGVTRERVRQIEKQAILKLRKEIKQINPHMASAFDNVPARFSPATKTCKQ